MNPRRRRSARARRSHRVLATSPGVQLAVANALFHEATRDRPLTPEFPAGDLAADREWDASTAPYADAYAAALARVPNQAVALAQLRARPAVRAVAKTEIRRLGLVPVAVTAFGPGWREHAAVML